MVLDLEFLIARSGRLSAALDWKVVSALSDQHWPAAACLDAFLRALEKLQIDNVHIIENLWLILCYFLFILYHKIN
jgi:hypothetical protein